MSIVKAFNKAFQKKEERGWDVIYVWVDIHETILLPTYELNGKQQFYPFAIEVLWALTQRKDVSLGLYTCSYPEEIEIYLETFKGVGIEFEHININTAEKNNKYGCFDTKPYFNVL
ncbi:MAG: hypothetical protein R3182_06825, partial [Draconibacterium sp.]|nr:hypothetical protein [Draconibacterium sp.]